MHGQGDGDTGTALRGRLSLPLVVALALVAAAAAAAGVLDSGRTSAHPAVTLGHHHPPHASGARGSGAPGPGSPSTAQPASTTPTTGSTAALPGVVADCSGPSPTGERTSVEPSSIVVACADHGIFLEHLTWSSWGSERATASGILAANDCTPSCAEGSFRSYPASFVLSGPEPSPGGAAFSDLTVTYEGTGLRYPTGSLVTSFTLEVPRG